MKSTLLFLGIIIMAIYEQNLSKPTCFRACAIAMQSRFALLFFVLLLFYDGSFRLNNLACETTNFKIQHSKTRFIFTSLRSVP